MNKELKDRIRSAIKWSLLTISISYILSIFVFFAERDTNPNFSNLKDTYWWWVLSISGLGGSEVPQSLTGTIFGSLVVFSGLFLFAIVISQVTAAIRLLYEKNEVGAIRVSYSDHIVIYGYTSLTAGVVKLLRRHYGHNLKIVLVSNDINRNPFDNHVDFIYGNPISNNTLIEANVINASAVIVLANDRFINPDGYSLVIASSIEKLNERVVTIVELLDPNMKSLFKAAKVDGFLDRKLLLKDLIDTTNKSRLIKIINKKSDLDEDLAEDEVVELV